jgi:hypothetical protein
MRSCRTEYVNRDSTRSQRRKEEEEEKEEEVARPQHKEGAFLKQRSAFKALTYVFVITKQQER